MKFAKFTAVALMAALVAVGCGSENSPFDNNEGAHTSNKGLLSIENLSIDCRIDESIPDAGLNPSPSSVGATRSSVDVNNFDCAIINEENEVVKSFKFGERPTEAFELETGDYIFKIQSGDVPGAAWDTPVYGTLKAFKIVRNETTTLSEIVCSLMQIKVTVTYAADLLERLGDKTLTTVVVGDNSLEFPLTESRSGFFAAPQVNNTIELRISGTYAADKVNFKPVEMTKEVRDVKAGQHSKVHFYIEHSAEGNINVGVTLRDWVTDEIIPCNVADLITEEEWQDNSGNEGGEVETSNISVEWLGYDISKRTTIDQNTTGEVVVRAAKGIKELIVRIESAALSPMLQGVGLVDVINLTYLEKSYDSANPNQPLTEEQIANLETNLKPIEEGGLLGFKYGEDVINKTEVQFSITPFMVPLNAIKGNHDFHFTITDNDGSTAKASLMLKSNGM